MCVEGLVVLFNHICLVELFEGIHPRQGRISSVKMFDVCSRGVALLLAGACGFVAYHCYYLIVFVVAASLLPHNVCASRPSHFFWK